MLSILFFTGVLSQQVQVSNLTQTLLFNNFQGHWISQIEEPFDYLESIEGETQIQFNYLLRQQQNATTPVVSVLQIQTVLLDPKYYDEKVIASVFEISNFNDTILDQTGQSNLTYLKFYKQRDQDFNITCPISYTLLFVQNDDNNNLERFNLQMNAINQTECKIDINALYTFDNSNTQFQILLYSVLLNTMCAIQYFCVTKLTESLLNEESQNTQRISVFCVGFVTIYDTYLAFQNLNFAFRTPYFQYFILPSFFFFLLTMNCDLKLLWIVCRTRFNEQFQDPQQQRQFLARFFIIYYVSVLTLFLLLQTFELYNEFLLLIGFFITPQIIHNFKVGTNPKFIPEYIFGFLLVNITVPLYFRGNPNNFRKLKPSLEFCLLWIFLYFAQIFVLYLQYKYGPRKIIPKCLLPKQYNYYQQYKPQDSEECAICLLHLMIEPDQEEQDLDRMLFSKILMVTPCGHKFHPSCLKNWMDVKLTCPTCRKNIPPVSE